MHHYSLVDGAQDSCLFLFSVLVSVPVLTAKADSIPYTATADKVFSERSRMNMEITTQGPGGLSLDRLNEKHSDSLLDKRVD